VPAFGQPRSSPERIHGFVVLWREREGVEPTAPTAGLPPTVLKTAGATRPHPLPCACHDRTPQTRHSKLVPKVYRQIIGAKKT